MLRNSFILLTLAFLLGCSKKNDGGGGSGSDIDIRNGMNLIGKITADGQPLANVVVSDGYSVVRSDAEGIYQMVRNKNARFVFVSIPADCEVPLDPTTYRPGFYRALDPSKELIREDFSFKKIEKENEFTLVALADPQFNSNRQYGLFSSETVPDILQTVEGLGNKPVYGMVLGDLVWDAMNYFSKFPAEFARFSFPFFTVIGNHDYNRNVKNDDAGAQADYEKNFGPVYYSFNRGDCHIVVLDDIVYNGGGANGQGYETAISAEQMAWLKKDLMHVSRDKLLIVCLHVNTKTRFTATKIANNEELYAALSGYKVRILSGHTHWNGNVTINDDITEHIHGAACGAFWSGPINKDGTPNGYGIYRIKGNRVEEHYYKATGFPKSYQMRLYPLNTSASRPNQIIANIWNWHTTWKSIKVYENGVEMGQMKQFEEKNAKDPYARWLLDLSGEVTSSYAESIITDHLFYYTPTDPHALIRVEATDEYGNVYTEEIYADADPGFPGPV